METKQPEETFTNTETSGEFGKCPAEDMGKNKLFKNLETLMRWLNYTFCFRARVLGQGLEKEARILRLYPQTTMPVFQFQTAMVPSINADIETTGEILKKIIPTLVEGLQLTAPTDPSQLPLKTDAVECLNYQHYKGSNFAN